MSGTYEFGQIYTVKDQHILYPDNRKRRRKFGKNRPVLILDYSEEKDYSVNPLITIAPISTKIDYKKQYDIDIEQGTCALFEKSLVRVGCLQSVLKSDLCDFFGDENEFIRRCQK